MPKGSFVLVLQKFFEWTWTRWHSDNWVGGHLSSMIVTSHLLCDDVIVTSLDDDVTMTSWNPKWRCKGTSLNDDTKWQHERITLNDSVWWLFGMTFVKCPEWMTSVEWRHYDVILWRHWIMSLNDYVKWLSWMTFLNFRQMTWMMSLSVNGKWLWWMTPLNDFVKWR